MLTFNLDLPMDRSPFVKIWNYSLVEDFTWVLNRYLYSHVSTIFHRFDGSSAFLLFNLILFTVYSIRPKRKAQINLHLLLDHLAQTLYVLSLRH